VCPLCYGTKEIIKKIKPCDGSNLKPQHPHYCLCRGIGYYYKTIQCPSCDGKGYRDWIDVIRRPIENYRNASNETL